MEVTVQGKIDIESIEDASLLSFANFITETAKVFFGKPENMKKFEAWQKSRQPT